MRIWTMMMMRVMRDHHYRLLWNNNETSSFGFIYFMDSFIICSLFFSYLSFFLLLLIITSFLIQCKRWLNKRFLTQFVWFNLIQNLFFCFLLSSISFWYFNFNWLLNLYLYFIWFRILLHLKNYSKELFIFLNNLKVNDSIFKSNRVISLKHNFYWIHFEFIYQVSLFFSKKLVVVMVVNNDGHYWRLFTKIV